MALNVAVDLEPFSRINPCGFANLEVTDLERLGVGSDLVATSLRLLPHFAARIGAADDDIAIA
jgi:lipoyl(octanoyl) transferase